MSTVGETASVSAVDPGELRARRRALGLTQVELADCLGVSANTVARSGQDPPGGPRRAAVGIAESAHNLSVGRLAGGKPRPVGAAEQILVAENAIALSALRATFARAAGLVDAFHQQHLTDDASSDELHGVFAEVQAAKTFACGAAATIVDRALTLSNGAGYLRGHPLERAYRDVRAGAFMQPLGHVRALEYLARVTLGLDPALA